MATSVDCVIGWGVSNGEEIDATETRWSTLSSFDVVGGATPLAYVGGVLPTGGNAFGVTQTATPGMKVTVIAGRVVVPANSAGVPPFALTLLANTDLDIATAHASNPRIDLVIAKIYSPGTSAAAGTVEILTGTAAASPTRPTLPSGDYHCISLATVTVPAAASSILNANITKAESDTWTTATSDAQYFAPPGGTLFRRNLMTMSSTRRSAWAAQYCPGTPWWDGDSVTFGVTGSDAIPLSSRTLYSATNLASQQANSTTPVQVDSTGTLVVFGSSRRIRITMSGMIGTDRNAEAGWNAARVFLTSTGTLTLPSSLWRVHKRVWGAASSASTVSQEGFSRSGVFTVAAGSFSVQMLILRVAGGGSGTGDNVICTEAAFLVEDLGPA